MTTKSKKRSSTLDNIPNNAYVECIDSDNDEKDDDESKNKDETTLHQSTNIVPTNKKQKTKLTTDEQLFNLRMQLGELGSQEMTIQSQKNKLSKSIKKLMKKLSIQNAGNCTLTLTESASVDDAVNSVFPNTNTDHNHNSSNSNNQSNENQTSSSSSSNNSHNNNANAKYWLLSQQIPNSTHSLTQIS